MQSKNVKFRCPSFDNCLDVLARSLQSGAFFIREVVALIYPHDAGAASRDVVENLLRHFEANPEPLKARCGRAAQVVKAPIRHAGLHVQGRLGLREAVEWAAKTGEDQLAKARRTAQQVLRWGNSGTICVAPFLARLAGMVQVERSSDNSAQVMPAAFRASGRLERAGGQCR